MNKKLGFTLAEVLVTLGIIGVVASMTIPTLIQNIQDNANAAAAKKTFSVLSNATNLIINDNGGIFANVFANSTDIRDAYANKMHVVKKCNNSLYDGCWAMDWKSGPNWTYVQSPGFVLNDGTFVFFSFQSANSFSCTATSYLAQSVCGEVYVDTNGAKNPNTAGKDILLFVIYKDRLRLGATNQDYYSSSNTAVGGYYGCPNGTNPLQCQLNLF